MAPPITADSSFNVSLPFQEKMVPVFSLFSGEYFAFLKTLLMFAELR